MTEGDVSKRASWAREDGVKVSPVIDQQMNCINMFFIFTVYKGMSQIELKNIIAKKISTVTDEDLLQEIIRLLDIELENLSPYQFNSEQITVVEEAQQQIKKGEYLNEEEADKEIDKWLNE